MRRSPNFFADNNHHQEPSSTRIRIIQAIGAIILIAIVNTLKSYPRLDDSVTYAVLLRAGDSLCYGISGAVIFHNLHLLANRFFSRTRDAAVFSPSLASRSSMATPARTPPKEAL